MTLRKEEAAALRQTFLLHNLSTRTFTEFSRRTDLSFRRMEVRANAPVELPQGNGNTLAIVVSGELTTAQGVRLPEKQMGPGFVLGALDLFSRYPMNLPEIRAKATTALLLVSATQMRQLFLEYPAIMMNYINFLTGQVQDLKWENRLHTAGTPEQRLGLFLELYWRRTDEGYVVQLPFSLSALAERLQLSRSSLYRLLDRLEAEGVLSRQGKHIIVKRPERLL